MATFHTVPRTYTPSHNITLDEAVKNRHSSRRFKTQPVPKTALSSALDLAAHAPSNSNTQPWRLYILTGPALHRLTTALLAAASAGTPNIPPLPPKFTPFRSETGKLVYGTGLGIPRDDKEARAAAVMRNFDFFGAPAAAIVCMDESLPGTDALSVGMYLQTFLLGLAEEGVGSCVEISVAGYPEVIREVVGIPGEMRILCGVAIGFEEESVRVNQVVASRQKVEETTVMLDE